ncbi:carboxypeptidase regulatory-like domain-containing protein [Jidongwangia harbinensis]|uniref:carboxypeptidase regulatory-like domain-containing protein n=1 Tax=Jidongwangia harbinensis TaxID=2878561 RepID=UPI001CD951E6|nr:carboxypeptidase regulatory-like domain-containing protein [Jidongwangia harbinensis]MCA2212874.1 carboxypeptidase regulatory-like domain-containing protein [Jidongwangia harbinensis]
MTTHLRARAVQAGAFLALVGGTIAVAAAPAHARPPTVSIDSVSSTDLGPGERTTIKYTVTNTNNNPTLPGAVRVNVTGMTCSGDCSPRTTIPAGESRSFTANLSAGDVDAGEEKTVRVQVTARLNNETGTASEEITVAGPDKPKQVRQVSGRVKDGDGKAVANAQVLMKDSAGNQYDTTSNGDGGYEFTSSDNRPIVPGSISVGAAKEGYDPAAVSVRGSAGKTVTATLTLVSKNAPSPSASATPSAKASAETLDDEDEAADDATQAPTIDPNAASNNSADDGGGSMLFIILGGLLVAAGIGAIVLVLMRRKDNGDDPDGGDKPLGVPPAGPGRYGDDATRMAAPVGGRANDATMVADLGVGPSLADAPTMLHRPVPAEEEFPDPYGAPASPPQAGNYGAPPPNGAYAGGQQYGAPDYDDGYGAEPQPAYGAPAATGTYGGAAAAQPRYDEPTGMYRPEDQNYGGYPPEPEYPPAGRGRPEPTGATSYQAGGYGEPQQPADQGTYGQWDEPAAGGTYGGGAGYGGDQYADDGYAAPPAGGTYGAPAAPAGGGGGYEGGGYGGDPGGYDPRATYGRPEGYGRAPEPGAGGTYGGGAQPGGAPQPGGYGGGYPEQGGYRGGEQGGGRHGGQPRPQEPGHPGQRRSLDWLDD